VRGWLAGLVLALPGLASADWIFDAPLTVAGEAREGVFQRLDSSNRQAIAAGDGRVAVVWHDNVTGSNQAYLALLAPGSTGFGPPMQVSAGAEAYEPAVTALGDGVLAVVYEEDGRVRLRFAATDLSAPVDLGPGSQGVVAPAPGGAYVAWAAREGRHQHIRLALVERGSQGARVAWSRPVEPEPPAADQLFPALSVSARGAVLAWEDRRHGHTRLYTAVLFGERFSAPAQLNELPPPRNTQFGRGTGVTRVALASDGGSRVVATWLDKRDFEGGYDTYAAISEDGGLGFGANELVQDLFGANQPQWHPVVAVGADGTILVAWDDPRDGSPDVWLSTWDGSGWSDDFTVEGAHGPGVQDNPALVFDESGALHLVWVERVGGGSQLRYARGQRP
jgi:hypothetical protein